jgi:hypothetical protein
MGNFLQVQGYQQYCTKTYYSKPAQAIPQTCHGFSHAFGVIDAEIAEKGHWWMETI